MESYTVDPKLISLQGFQRLCSDKKMIPSRLILQEGLDQHFSTLGSLGIRNMKELLSALGSPSKIEQLSGETGISEKYLSLLKREAGSYLSKAFPLSDFPGIPLEYTEVLKTRGIKNTKQFFEDVQSPEQRKEMAASTGIPLARLAEIYSLCDLSRITGVGGFYARIIYHAGICSVEDFAGTDAAAHNVLYLASLARLGYPVKALGEEDLQYCINYAILIRDLNTNPDSS